MNNDDIIEAVNSFIKTSGNLGNLLDAYIKGYLNSLIEHNTKNEEETKKTK